MQWIALSLCFVHRAEDGSIPLAPASTSPRNYRGRRCWALQNPKTPNNVTLNCGRTFTGRYLDQTPPRFASTPRQLQRAPATIEGDVIGHPRTRKPPTTSPSTAGAPSPAATSTKPRHGLPAPRANPNKPPQQSRATLLGTPEPENPQQRHPQPRKHLHRPLPRPNPATVCQHPAPTPTSPRNNQGRRCWAPQNPKTPNNDTLNRGRICGRTARRPSPGDRTDRANGATPAMHSQKRPGRRVPGRRGPRPAPPASPARPAPSEQRPRCHP